MNKRSERDRESISPRASSNHVFPSCERVRHVYQMLLKVLDMCMSEWVSVPCMSCIRIHIRTSVYALLIFSFIFFSLINSICYGFHSVVCMLACLLAWALYLSFQCDPFSTFFCTRSLCACLYLRIYTATTNENWTERKKQQQQQLH